MVIKKMLHSTWFLLGIGLVVGAAVVLGVRFLTYAPESVHYHANFALYINGQREQFKGPQYYEETAATSCTLEHVDDPAERAHMHDNVNDVVHVEDHLVTWGNFFQNIGWGLGDKYLSEPDEVYSVDAEHKLTFTLNGKKVDSVANRIIGDQDKLLVSFGNDSDSQIQKEYAAIQNSARKYDTEQDPAGCSGTPKASTSDRFKHLF